MRILGLISKYFLILMIIQGFLVAFIDSRSFKRLGMEREVRKSKVFGIGAILISTILYLLQIYVA